MLNPLGLFLAVIALLFGAFLLYDPVPGPVMTQTVRLLGGATLVSFGVLTILLIARDWLIWRRHHQNGVKHDQNRSM